MSTGVIIEVLTGQTPQPQGALWMLALRCENANATRLDWLEAAELNARICEALMPGWEFAPAVPSVPEEREPDGPRGRKGKIIKSRRPELPAHIRKTTRISYPKGAATYRYQSSPAPKVTTDIAQVWGLLHGRMLLHLFDVGNGFAEARVAPLGHPRIYAEGCGATAILSLCAAILRCEASVREATP